jgi:hypothetical protein
VFDALVDLGNKPPGHLIDSAQDWFGFHSDRSVIANKG